MNTEQTIRDIKKLHSALTGKNDPQIICTYKGTDHGVQFPWLVYIDAHQVNALTYEAAVEMLRDNLKVELKKKAEDMARDAEVLKNTLNLLGN